MTDRPHVIHAYPETVQSVGGPATVWHHHCTVCGAHTTFSAPDLPCPGSVEEQLDNLWALAREMSFGQQQDQYGHTLPKTRP